MKTVEDICAKNREAAFCHTGAYGRNIHPPAVGGYAKIARLLAKLTR